MKEYPILFSTEMVKAILDGCKSITRRVVTKNNSTIGEGGDWDKFCWDGKEQIDKEDRDFWDKCPKGSCGWHVKQNDYRCPLPFKDGTPKYGEYLHVPYRWAEDGTIYRIYSKYEVGDRLWCKETFCHTDLGVIYKANMDDADMKLFNSYRKWKPSIFMPRIYSRITLEITNIKVERVQEICLADIQAEGIYDDRRIHNAPIQIGKFKALWDSINAKRGYPWANNPWCWCINFKRVI